MVHPGENTSRRSGPDRDIERVYGSNEVYFNLFLPSTPETHDGFPVAITPRQGAAARIDTPYQMKRFSGFTRKIVGSAINDVGRGGGPLGRLVLTP